MSAGARSSGERTSAPNKPLFIPINPREAEILGLKCYPSIGAVPQEIDFALVCTAAKTVPAVVVVSPAFRLIASLATETPATALVLTVPPSVVVPVPVAT